MTKWGMRPGVAHNPDPTFVKAEAHITGKERNRARHVATVMKAIAELAGYKVIGEITLKDRRENVWHMEIKREGGT